jgi:MFS family permease
MSSSTSESPISVSSAAPVVPAVNAAPGKPARVPLFSAEAWSPLKVELFRSLYIATSIAQIGTWIREAGGPWLMSELTNDNSVMVPRVLVFSNLPICLFSVFAGALADVLDRRRLLIVTQIWMMVVSALLGILTVTHHISPGGLLFLTFLVGTGTAAAGPALQALLPELVPRKDLALAINLNSVALNVARAMGPALFILVIMGHRSFAGQPGDPPSRISVHRSGSRDVVAGSDHRHHASRPG